MLLAVCWVTLAVPAQKESARDSIAALETDSVVLPKVSLLTCSPGVEIWQQYGHTAIRFEDTASDLDVVFNYGLFSFDQPHFIWRFCLGATDYIVGAEQWSGFEQEYTERGSSITLQQLNLTPEEIGRFWNLITTNCRVENRTYRYNFLYKNCSTMARDILLRSIGWPEGRPLVPESGGTDGEQSFRTILHEHNAAYPWASFGIDLLLGIAADRPVAHSLQEFAPAYLEEAFARARRSDGQRLVAETSVIPPAAPLPKGPSFPLTPVQTMILVVLLTAIICSLERLTNTRQWWYDILLYGIQGASGLILTFLFFFSTHPTVNSNILVILFNPIVLVLLPFLLHQRRRHTVPWAAWVEGGLIVALVVVWFFIPQVVPVAAWVFIGALFLRTGHHILMGWKRR